MTNLTEIARMLDEAAVAAAPMAQVSADTPLSPSEAYEVQTHSLARRFARGEKRVGVKMGLTSRAKMAQVGVSDMVWGRLTDAMQLEEGGATSMARYIHPRIEPEIAFYLNAPLAGPVTAPEALAAVEAVAPALELIDSRYRDFKFDLGDVIADNCSAAGFVVGPPSAPSTDLANLGMVLSLNGEAVAIGSSAAILGHPLRALVAAARLVGERGGRLEAGDIVLAGAATEAVPLRPGVQVRLEVQHLGAASLRVEA